MNRQNLKNYGNRNMHHLTPYQKKNFVVKNKVVDNEFVTKGVTSGIEPVIGQWYNPENLDRIFNNQPVDNFKLRPKPVPPESIPEKKEEPDITIVKPADTYKHKTAFESWHKHRTYKYRDNLGELSISDSVGGCGMQQLYSWTSIDKYDIALALIDAMLKDLHHGTGLVICQLGKDYFHEPFEQALIESGFVSKVKYKNWTHGDNGKYKQKVYMKIIDKE